MQALLLLCPLLLIAGVFSQTQVCPDGVSISLTKPDTVLENGLVTFTCSVTVPSDVSLPTEASWRKDYIPLDTSDTSRYDTGHTVTSPTQVSFTFEILQAIVEDSGTYSCDPIIPGSLCRESVNLTVNYALAVIVEDQDELTGSDVALQCVVRGDSASAVWYRYNETLDEYIKLTTDSGKYSFSQEGSEFILSFSSASSADTGVYRCEGLSPAGRIDKDFNFYSLVAPSNTYIRGSNNGQFFGFSGDDLQLTCVSEGVRAPQYNWTINDVELEEDTEDLKFNRSTGELTIVGATKFDEGTYRCSAYNKAGSETTNVVVIIHIVATIVDQVLAVSVGLGGTAVLTCTLSASPPINTIQWIVSNTDPVVNSTKYRFYYNGTLIIYDVAEADDTTYRLKACNTISGLIQCTQSQPISVLVTLPSPAPTRLAILSENADARTVRISWTNPATNTRNSPDFFVIQVRTSEMGDYVTLDEEIPVTSSSGYTVTRLFPGYQNFFRLLGSNLGGLGGPSNEVNVTLSAGVPRIRSVSVDVLSSTSLNVSYQLWHDGGNRITAVMVGYKENSSLVWNNITENFPDTNATNFVIISDLTSATYYNVRVRVSNSQGKSEYFEPVEKLLPDSVPGVPVLREVAARHDSVSISITLDDFGTGQLLGFFIKYVLDSNETIEEISVGELGLSLGEELVWEITGLESEVTYLFSAAGNSTIGLGPYSSEVSIYTDTRFFEHLYFKIFVGIAGVLTLFVLLLLFLACCIGCFCFSYGKRRQYSHFYKPSRSGAENLGLTEDGAEGNEYPPLPPSDTLLRHHMRDESFSERGTPPAIPPRTGNFLEDAHVYRPTPPLPGYTTVKDPKHNLLRSEYPADPFGAFQTHKNFMGQDKQGTHSLGNISQGSFITDV